MNDRQKERLILAAGIALRLLYVLLSTIYERQYDISEWDLSAGYAGGGGHLGYIHYLYEYGHLPDMNPATVYQFSHPPLHYALTALWLKGASIFVKDPAVLAESIQILPLLYGIGILVCFAKILDLTGLRGRGRSAALLIIAFHPSLILLSGSVNNDALALLLTLLTVYFLMRWARERKMRTVLWLALCLGLGIMTKLSVAEMLLPCGLVFLYVVYRERKGAGHTKSGTGLKAYLAQAAVFLGVSLPLGFWFYLRNYVVWKIPLTFVHDLGTDSWQYIGDVPLVNRYLFPVPSELFANLRALRIGCGYNQWVQIMRTSVTGEWDMAGVPAAVKALAMLLMLTGAVLAVWALIAFVRLYVFGRGFAGVQADRVLFVSAYLTFFALYVKFSMDNPYQCSMDFRYIRPLLFLPAVALGLRLNGSGSRQGGTRLRDRVFWLILTFFCVLSAAMTLAWGLL